MNMYVYVGNNRFEKRMFSQLAIILPKYSMHLVFNISKLECSIKNAPTLRPCHCIIVKNLAQFDEVATWLMKFVL